MTAACVMQAGCAASPTPAGDRAAQTVPADASAAIVPIDAAADAAVEAPQIAVATASASAPLPPPSAAAPPEPPLPAASFSKTKKCTHAPDGAAIGEGSSHANSGTQGGYGPPPGSEEYRRRMAEILERQRDRAYGELEPCFQNHAPAQDTAGNWVDVTFSYDARGLVSSVGVSGSATLRAPLLACLEAAGCKHFRLTNESADGIGSLQASMTVGFPLARLDPTIESPVPAVAAALNQRKASLRHCYRAAARTSPRLEGSMALMVRRAAQSQDWSVMPTSIQGLVHESARPCVQHRLPGILRNIESQGEVNTTVVLRLVPPKP